MDVHPQKINMAPEKKTHPVEKDAKRKRRRDSNWKTHHFFRGKPINWKKYLVPMLSILGAFNSKVTSCFLHGHGELPTAGPTMPPVSWNRVGFEKRKKMIRNLVIFLATKNTTSPEKVAFSKGNPWLFQGNLGW